jgi:hypothetical protein
MSDAGYHILENVGAGAEVGVEDEEEVALSAGEGVAKIASFLEVRPVVSADVVETVCCGKTLDRVHGTIVENPDFEVGVVDLGNVLVGIFQDFDGFLAAGKVNVDRGAFFIILDSKFFHNLLVAFHVEVFTAEADKVGDREIGLNESNENTKPVVQSALTSGLNSKEETYHI